MKNIDKDDFAELIGEDLSGVVFVRDYIQLQFNSPPLLNAYTPVTVTVGGKTAKFREEAFANLVIGQINKVVKDVKLILNESLEVQFQDGSTISVSLKEEHYEGPEAVNFFRKDKEVIVI